MKGAERWSALLVATTAVVEATVVDAPAFVRAPLGALLVLGVGASASMVAFPPGRCGWLERFASTCALALSALIVVSVGLELSPWDLSARAWALALGVVGVGASAVVWVRGVRRPDEVAAGSGAADRTRAGRPRWRRRDVVTCVGVVVVLVCAVGVARRPFAPPDASTGYSQLWMLPSPDGPTLGVVSFEFDRTSFRIDLLAGDVVVQTWAVDLDPTQRWTASAPGVEGDLEARLYRVGDPVVYRRVQLVASEGEAP